VNVEAPRHKHKAAAKDNAAKVEGREIAKAGVAPLVAVRAPEAIEVTTGAVAIVVASKGRPKSISKN
jgi:hypothetical protein